MLQQEFGAMYKRQIVEQWWQRFWEKDAFYHPQGQVAATSLYQEKLPVFFCENPDLHKKLIFYPESAGFECQSHKGICKQHINTSSDCKHQSTSTC